MDVQMRHSLPSSRAVIDANVESVRRIRADRRSLRIIEEREKTVTLVFSHFEE
jgi:hypothetical protein